MSFISSTKLDGIFGAVVGTTAFMQGIMLLFPPFYRWCWHAAPVERIFFPFLTAAWYHCIYVETITTKFFFFMRQRTWKFPIR
jgi:hypothetical protein